MFQDLPSRGQWGTRYSGAIWKRTRSKMARVKGSWATKVEQSLREALKLLVSLRLRQSLARKPLVLIW
jgi:hypothetical protein